MGKIDYLIYLYTSFDFVVSYISLSLAVSIISIRLSRTKRESDPPLSPNC